MNLFIKLCLIGVLILIKESSCNGCSPDGCLLPSNCDGLVCKNGGTCKRTLDCNDVSKIVCHCKPHYYGHNCENKVDVPKMNNELINEFNTELLSIVLKKLAANTDPGLTLEFDLAATSNFEDILKKMVLSQYILSVQIKSEMGMVQSSLNDFNTKLDDVSKKLNCSERDYGISGGSGRDINAEITSESDLENLSSFTRYVGCFKDSYGKDLNGYSMENEICNTPYRCSKICRKKNFKYAAVQSGNKCFCGNSYGTYGESNGCITDCSGDDNKICGGVFANSVYEVNKIDLFDKLYKYIGCYKDQNERDLAGFHFEHSTCMTLEKCFSHCIQKNYRYAGLQNGCECYCSRDYGKYGKADNCNVQCKGDNTKTCGGLWANSVYEMLITPADQLFISFFS